MERTKKNVEEEKDNENLPETAAETNTDPIVDPEETPEPEETPQPDIIEKQEPAPEEILEPEYVDPDPVILWKKIGGGSLRLSKRLIPPGSQFKARLSEIPKAFRDLVVQMDNTPIPTAPAVAPVKVVKSVYQVVPRGKSKSMFDIIGPNGKKVNELPLTKAIADQLAQDLGKQ
jgi:hypothetical protein